MPCSSDPCPIHADTRNLPHPPRKCKRACRGDSVKGFSGVGLRGGSPLIRLGGESWEGARRATVLVVPVSCGCQAKAQTFRSEVCQAINPSNREKSRGVTFSVVRGAARRYPSGQKKRCRAAVGTRLSGRYAPTSPIILTRNCYVERTENMPTFIRITTPVLYTCRSPHLQGMRANP